MTFNGRLLARARTRLDEIRAENQAEQARRETEVRQKLPRLAELDAELRATMTELMGLAISHGADISAELAELEARNLSLQAERAELLVGAGYPMDYTEAIYTCPVCKDGGMAEGRVCSCLLRLYNRELTGELSALLRRGDESFEKFDLSLYGLEPDAATGLVPRECMELVFNNCRDWAERFGPDSPNLLFRGGTGLGKTFLSACIARRVAEKGFSVAYESTAAALEAFETQKFSREQQESERAAARVRQYLDCDLMILDDLGTEMVTAFSVSALYQIINGRLINGKKTIISTNLTADDMARKYTPQILSRLDGEYTLLPFVGRDIRRMRKNLQ